MSKKKNKTKRRKISIDFSPATATFDQIRVDSASGRIETLLDGVPVNAMEDASLIVSYERPKGPKIIARIPIVGERKVITPYSFIESFDVVFAVDTNTRVIRGQTYSIGAMAILRVLDIQRYPDDAIASVKMNMNMFGVLIRGKNYTENPEPWFWRTAIEDGIIKKFDGYSESLRIGVVVDSCLDVLKKYNSRELPIHESYFLPKNVTLIYASADTGSDYPLNKLLSICDKEAKLQLDKVEEGIDEAVIETKLGGSEERKAPNTPFRLHED